MGLVIKAQAAYESPFWRESGLSGTGYLSDWGGEQYTRGAYASSYDLGGLSRWGHLQNQPVGSLFFASSDIQGVAIETALGSSATPTARAR